MRFRLEFLRSSVLWLMTATSLFAALPQVQCTCPDGRTKVVCFSSQSSIDQSICCQRVVGPGEQKSCCLRESPASESPGQSLAPQGCRKYLVHFEVLTSGTPADPTLGPSEPAGVPVGFENVGTGGDAGGADILSLRLHSVPPPIDRVVLFRHIVI